jgi:HK97 family phage portal protein
MLGYIKRRRLENEVAALRLQKELTELGVRNEMTSSSGRSGSELYDLLTGGSISHAGTAVNEHTAMKFSAVYACVGLISGAIASLPLPIYQRTEDGRSRANHDLWWLLNEQPHPCWSAFAFWLYLFTSKLLYGDAFALIHRQSERSPKISSFEPIHPNKIEPLKEGGRLKYAVWDDAGKARVYDQDDVLHFSGLGFDGRRSLSPIRHAARNSVGLALAAEEYSSRFFSNGARPDIVLEIPGNLTDEQIRQIRESWVARFGGVSNSHLPAIGAGGMKVHPLSINAEDAQLISTRQFQVIDIARIYGVPPFMIGETEKQSSWGTGVENMGVGFVKYTLRPHLVGAEHEINRKCFRTITYFSEFNVDGLMEGDSKAQAEYFSKALGGPGTQGWMSVNEVRRLKNMEPKAGYDDVHRAGATKPKEAANEPDSETTSK